jgi:hypothetical protein
MTWKRPVSGLAAVFVIVGSLQAEERRYSDQVSGTGAPSSFDANGDGVNGLYVTFAGRSNFGPVHGGIMVDYNFRAAAPHFSCPVGTVKLPVVASAGTRAITYTDGQLFMRDDAANALFCLNLVTGAFTMSIKGTVTGGLGRFAGAKGSYEYKGVGNVLLNDHTGMPFGGFVVETEGKITVPHGRDRD